MPIHITNAAELQDVNLDTTADYILDNDIDLMGITWTPLGGPANYAGNYHGFTGTFDGNGKTIRNLTYTDEILGNGFAALFGAVGRLNYNFGETTTVKGTIKNLNLDNFNITGNGDVAALFAWGSYCDIENVHVTNLTLNTVDNFPYEICGIGGFMYGNSAGISTIKNCSVTNMVVNQQAGTRSIFGACGITNFYLRSGATADKLQMLNCHVDGFTCAWDNRGDTIGGVCGQNDGYIYKCSAINVSFDLTAVDSFSGSGDVGALCGENFGLIANCYAQGEIIKANYDAGGLVGWNNTDFLMKNCWADVNVSGDGVNDFDMGGLIGYVNSGIIRNCYSVGEVSGANEVGGFAGGTTTDAIIENCSWWTGSSTNAIGANNNSSPLPLLSSADYGTDEAVKTAFYSKTHAVYAQV